MYLIVGSWNLRWMYNNWGIEPFNISVLVSHKELNIMYTKEDFNMISKELDEIRNKIPTMSQNQIIELIYDRGVNK